VPRRIYQRKDFKIRSGANESMVKVYTLNAFTKNDEGGNPAGVCLDAENLSEQEMQSIASKLNYSETAFVQKSKVADFKIRFFSPDIEVPLCGHATIATFCLMAEKNWISKGKYKQETKAGTLEIEVNNRNMIFMRQNLPSYGKIDKEKVLDCLNLNEDQLIPELPVEIVSTGFPAIIVPIRSQETVRNLQIDLEKSKRLSDKKLLLHVFTLETINTDSTAFSRNFLPVTNLGEDPATGTSSGALACYLFRHGLVNGKSVMKFEQGHTMGRPSEIQVQLKTKGEKINEVVVGRRATITGELEIIL
jgi:PhzF family phenazine biosynthesis protein